MHLRTILVPTDYSDVSQAAFAYAVELARDYGSRVLVLHVEDTLGAETATYGEVSTQLQPESHRARLETTFRKAVPAVPGIAMEYLLHEGDPVEEVLRVAQERHCDLIVVGSHGRDGWRRLLDGSTAEDIERHAPCPVLIVRASMVPA